MSINKLNSFKSAFVVYFVISFFSACTNYSGKEGNVKVSVDLKNAENLTAIVQVLKSKEVLNIDTVQFDKNGALNFYINSDELSFYSILFENEKQEIRFLAEEGDDIEIKGDLKDLFKTLHFSGNSKLDQLNEFYGIVIEYSLILDSLKSAYATLMEKNQHYAYDEEFNEKYRKATQMMNKKVIGFTKNNQDQFITLLALRSLSPNEFLNLYKETASNLQKSLPNSSYVIHFVNEVKKLSNMSIGGEIPDFSLPNKHDEFINLHSFKGKYVLLDIWATWCKPCKAEMPFLEKAKEQFKDKNFEVVSVCVDRKEVKAAWIKTIEDLKTEWVHVFDENGEGIVDLYGIKMFPTLILVDPEGKIIESSNSQNSNFRREEMLKVLEGILL